MIFPNACHFSSKKLIPFLPPWSFQAQTGASANNQNSQVSVLSKCGSQTTNMFMVYFISYKPVG